MKKLFLGMLLIFLLGNVLASCGDNQIDVNSASVSELDALYGIGPAKAQAIIDARPYEALDDLINAKGIGEVTLEGIKSQGLACIEDSPQNTREDSTVSNSTIEPVKTDLPENGPSVVQPSVISLGSNAKAIKSEDVNEKSDNNAFYGLIVFGVAIIALMLIKKRKYRNEFNNG